MRLHHLALKGESRKCDFWVTKDTGEAGGVIHRAVFFPWGRIVDRYSGMGVVNSVRGDKSTHATMKFSFLDGKNG